MKPIAPLAVLSCFAVMVTMAQAQHCPPIVESYLSQISVKHGAKDQALDLKVEYSKSGGQRMPKYQIYLLAYLEKNQDRLPAPPPADFIDKEVVRVLHTQAVERNKEGKYEFHLQLNRNELAKKIIELGRLTDKDRGDNGGWGYFKDKFRLAIFVPFLADSKYSVLNSLPEDKHECNYDARRALLFQPLPYSFSIHFGIVQAERLAEGEYYIQINEAEPARALSPRRESLGGIGQTTAAAASPPAVKPVTFETYGGYFVSNKFEPDAAESFVVANNQEQFDKVFGTAFVMGDKSHRLPRDAFKTLMVVAAIKRGSAMWEYKVESVTEAKGIIEIRYTAAEKKRGSAKFASPLIVSIPKGECKAVRFLENGTLAKEISLVAKQVEKGGNTSAVQKRIYR